MVDSNALKWPFNELRFLAFLRWLRFTALEVYNCIFHATIKGLSTKTGWCWHSH